jgi:hypothetical protein
LNNTTKRKKGKEITKEKMKRENYTGLAQHSAWGVRQLVLAD